MSIHKTQALILNKRDFRETSLIVDFYTKEFGKISGLLKGVRAEADKFASNLEIFSLNEIVFYRRANSSLHLVSQADKIENFTGARNHLEKTTLASFMMELVGSIMQLEDKNEEIFDLTVNCLKELETNYNPDKIATIFKIKILALSGFKPHFDSCVICSEKIMAQSKFSMALGGLLCAKCCHKDLSSRNIFRGTVATILHIERGQLRSGLNLGMNPEIKKELGVILNSFLNFHLGKELKSQRVMQKLSAGV